MPYQQPGGGERDCIASTPHGWFYAPWAGNGLHRYHSLVEDPQPAVQEASEFGWPWRGSRRGRVVPVQMDLDITSDLKALLGEARAI